MELLRNGLLETISADGFVSCVVNIKQLYFVEADPRYARPGEAASRRDASEPTLSNSVRKASSGKYISPL